jgi:hypothetical protein
MKRRFTEEQIIGILRQHESGMKTADVCREHNISSNTFYTWKSKFGGMNVSEAQARPSGCASLKPKMPSSNGLWPSRRWTTLRSRMCCQISCCYEQVKRLKVWLVLGCTSLDRVVLT